LFFVKIQQIRTQGNLPHNAAEPILKCLAAGLFTTPLAFLFPFWPLSLTWQANEDYG